MSAFKGRELWLGAGLWASLLASSSAFAVNYGGVDAFEQYGKRVHAAQEVSPLTDALFGDQTSLYNGATTFEVTDVSLPGNNALPVAVSRDLAIQDRRQQLADGDGLPGFGDWDLDVPYIDGVFTVQNGWTLYPSGAEDRCSDNTDWPDTLEPIPGGSGYAPYEEVWDGTSLHIPGESNQELLANTQGKSPAYASNGTYKWVTAGRWKLSCISSVANLSGEGFVAVSPSGVSYTFNYAVSMPTSSFAWQYDTKVNPLMVARVRIYLLATRVQDRFGNWVNYSYSGNHLAGIAASDGRSITLSWSGNTITSVTSALGTWTYAYATASHTDPNGVVETWTYLSSVTRPDGSQWTYSIDSGSLISDKNDWPADDTHPPNHCQLQPLQNTGSFVYTIGAPSGASGTFTFNYLRHFRDDVPYACVNDPDPDHNYPQQVAGFFDNFTLTSKQISGPGLVTQTWSYDYTGIANAGYYTASTPWNLDSTTEPYIPAGDCGCTTTKTVTVTGPVSITKYTYGIQYARNEGQLLEKQVEDLSGNVLATTTYALVSDAQAPNEPFPNIAGQDLLPNFQNPMGNRMRPVTQTTIAQDGATFTTAVNGFDAFARATSTTESSSLGYSKTDSTTYADDTSNWVLGLVTQTATNGIASSQTTYNSADRPYQQYVFGKLVSTRTWNSDGTLATDTDGDNNKTTFTNWYRGLPQKIAFADGTSKSATVNGDGWITAITDENGFTTNYAYDAMGRLASITYPSGDDVAWNPTLLSFTQVAGSEFGIAGGHWKQVVNTGNDYAVTYFDAFWRPLVTEHYDAGNESGTLSQVVRQYDADGRDVFTSYLIRSATSYTQSVPGTHTSYDALDRVTQVQQNSELGTLTTTTQYLSGFQTKVTDSRGYATTTAYQAYGEPTLQWPASVTAPQGELTVIMRDAFGKPLSVTRTGTASGSPQVTRSYVYDGYQQLCKRIEPETGATAFGYDGAGNLAWSASGLNLPSTTTCDVSAAEGSGQVVNRTYDTRNRIKSLTFPDGNGNQNWNYYPDGLPSTITRQNDNGSNALVTNSYLYDKRRLLTSEALAATSEPTWTLGYGHDANGHLASEVYPDGITVTFAPDALGQTSQLGSYASGAHYNADGSLAGFTYGNGIVHTLTENARRLPATIEDTGGGVTPIDQTYTYDADGDVTALSDAANSQQNRSMTYDGLDRLAVTSWTASGQSSSNTYDVLDNLTAISAASNVTFTYNPATNQLASLSITGQPTTTYTWDARGNLASAGSQGYAFDYGNRLRWATNLETYRYDGLGRRVWALSAQDNQAILSMYSAAGQLAFQGDWRNDTYHSYLYLGGHLVAIVDQPFAGGSSVRYQHTDSHGTIVAQTGASRALLSQSVYNEWGGTASHGNDDQPGYTGQVQDSLTTLTYMQQRYYAAHLRRFISADPVQADTDTGGNFNRYWYAKDNPYRYTDPDGRQTTGEYIDQQAQAAADSGNYVATYAWAFAGTAWNYLGAESVSQVVDKGAGASTGDKVMAAVAVVTLGKGEEAATAVKDVGEGAVDAAKGIEKAVADAQGPRFATGKLRQQVMDKGRQADGSVHCAYCGKPTATQSDHVVPYSKGGPTKIENLQPSCASCNASKGAKDLGKEWIPPKERHDQ